ADVECTTMRCAVGSHEPGAIDREPDRQVLDRDIMDDLVESALQEGGIDRRERLVALGGESRRKGYGMLFGNAHIEYAPGKFLAEKVQSGSIRHGRRNGDDLVVLARFLHQSLGKYLGIGGSIARCFRLRSGDDVELAHAMI